MLQEIDKFLRTFGGQLDANDTAEPIESFNTFNQFFYRKLKPSARPIAEPNHGHVVVSVVFNTGIQFAGSMLKCNSFIQDLARDASTCLA